MCADECGNGHRFLVRLANGFAEKDLCDEGSGERIACSYGVSNLHLRRSHIALLVSCEDIRTDSATSEDEHLEVIFGNEITTNETGLFRVLGNEFTGNGRYAEQHSSHYVEFLTAILGTSAKFEETNSRCYSDVDYSIPMMEAILVGTVAQQIPGKLNWCTKNQCFDNAAANTLIKPVIRKGFEF